MQGAPSSSSMSSSRIASNGQGVTMAQSGTFSEKELIAMRTPHAVLNNEKGWTLDRDKSLEIETMMQPYFGTEETEAFKNSIVEELQEIVTNWSCSLAVSLLKVSLQEAKSKHCARLLTFGSSILGVSSRKSDIDMVCACPIFISRSAHFEEEFANILLSNKHVRSLINIRTAKVPIITFVYKDQDIDISFAQVQLASLPLTIAEVVDDDLLVNMEERDVLSLSGRRCNQAIVRSVPNLPAFQVALRFVKLWAQSKGIYENSIGFLGGISWAILVAKISQMFPNYYPNQLLEKFFYYYSNWDFTNLHVLLNPYTSSRSLKQRAITQHMNVMTACFPEYNSTERVKEITLNIIKQRLNEANDLIQKEVKLRYKHYKDLLLNYDFVGSYSKFIEYGLFFKEQSGGQNGNTSMNSGGSGGGSSSNNAHNQSGSKSQPTEKEFEEFMNASKVKILTLIQRLSELKLKGVQFCPWPQFFTKTLVSIKKAQVIYIGINDSNSSQQQQLTKGGQVFNLEKECKGQITQFYQFIKNDAKYSSYLEKFDVGMEWISSKDTIRKTFKLSQNQYDTTRPCQSTNNGSQKQISSSNNSTQLNPLKIKNQTQNLSEFEGDLTKKLKSSNPEIAATGTSLTQTSTKIDSNVIESQSYFGSSNHINQVNHSAQATNSATQIEQVVGNVVRNTFIDDHQKGQIQESNNQIRDQKEGNDDEAAEEPDDLNDFY